MFLKTLALALLLASPFVLGTTLAGAPSVTLTMDAETYSAASTLTGAAPVASVLVLDAQGAPVAGASVRVAFIRQVQVVGFVGNETVMAVTGADGIATVAAPTASGAPGSYLVAGYALGAFGSDRYTVGA